jgi:hypothetical protein
MTPEHGFDLGAQFPENFFFGIVTRSQLEVDPIFGHTAFVYN